MCKINSCIDLFHAKLFIIDFINSVSTKINFLYTYLSTIFPKLGKYTVYYIYIKLFKRGNKLWNKRN